MEVVYDVECNIYSNVLKASRDNFSYCVNDIVWLEAIEDLWNNIEAKTVSVRDSIVEELKGGRSMRVLASRLIILSDNKIRAGETIWTPMWKSLLRSNATIDDRHLVWIHLRGNIFNELSSEIKVKVLQCLIKDMV